MSPAKIAVSRPHGRRSAALRVESHRLLEEVRRLHRQRSQSSPSSRRSGNAPAGALDSGACSGANIGQLSNAECATAQHNASCSKPGSLALPKHPSQ